MNQNSPKKIPPLWILSLASGLSPFGMAIVVPTLNSVATRFGASLTQAQFIISAYLLGLAFAQPTSGFLCDRFGRRPVMLYGFALFTIASIFCAFANSLDQLILARFIQALGVSVGTVASRAILRDTHEPNRMAIAMSYVAAATGLAPVLAPFVGGSLDANSGYNSIFYATATMGLIVFLSILINLSETLPSNYPKPKLSEWFGNYKFLLTSRKFVGYTLVFGFIQGGFFSFIAVGATLFSTEFNIGSGTFGLLWSMIAIAYVVGAAVSARLTAKLGAAKVMHSCLIFGAISGIAVLVCASIGDLSIPKLLIPLGFMMMFSGGSTPSSISAAIADHPERAGIASGLSSALGLVISGMFTIICGTVYTGDYQVIAMIIAASGIAMVLAWLFAQSGKRAQVVI